MTTTHAIADIKIGKRHRHEHGNTPADSTPTIVITPNSEVSRDSLTTDFFLANERSVGGTIEKGRIIKQGLDSLEKTEWRAWVIDDLHLRPWSAMLFVHISQHPILSDRRYWKFLPVDYRTLYELSRIPNEQLLEYINKGGVHHHLSRPDAVKLKRVALGKPAKQRQLPVPDIPDALAVFLAIARYFRSDEEWRRYMHQNPRPSELPSKEKTEVAQQWLEMKRKKMRGDRS